MGEQTDRLELPMIVPGQAGKEIAHNEAIARLAILTQPVVVAVGLTEPPTAPIPGQAWIVGASPTGDWAGHDNAIAGWTAGGWRFTAAKEGMNAWIEVDQIMARFIGGGWRIGEIRAKRLFIEGTPSIGPAQPPLDAPVGGDIIDVESRTSISSILDVLRYHGLIGGSA